MNDRTPFPFLDDDRFDGQDPDSDRMVQRLRGALSAEADLIEPGHDGLRQIKERIAAGEGRSGGRGPGGLYLPLLAAAAAVLVAAGATFGIIVAQRQPVQPSGHGTALPTTTPTQPRTPTQTPTPTLTSTTTRSTTTTSSDEQRTSGPDAGPGLLPVYWVAGATDGSVHLYREFYPDPVEATTASKRVNVALERMLAGEPRDPDYSSPWRPAPVDATVTDAQITVDLDAKAIAPKVQGAFAEAAIQQLVYTATAAAGTADPPRTVLILVDGRAGATAWGISLAVPLSRDSYAVAPVWVIAPEEGSRQAPGRVTVSGAGRGYEGQLRWQITDADGRTVADGVAQGGSAAQLVPFSFKVALDPGRFTVAVWSPSAKDETDPMPFVDTKAFTVR